jgi:hypothetical protein
VQTEQTGEREQTTWSEIDWAAAEAAVRRLQDRIYRAAAAGKRRQVKNLQKLLVRKTARGPQGDPAECGPKYTRCRWRGVQDA